MDKQELLNGDVTVKEPLYNAEQTLKQVAHMLGVTENIYRDVPLAVRALQVALRDGIAAKQAKIDALMFEFCPDKLTAEQIAKWSKHQKAAIVDVLMSDFPGDA